MGSASTADVAETPTPAGFGKCADCAFRDTGTPRICSDCARMNFEALAASRCGVCDLPYQSGKTSCGNPLCNRQDRQFTRNFAIAMRSGALEKAISRYKYEGKKGWGLIFARVLVGYLNANKQEFKAFDLITASPCYVGPGGSRDWDHTRLVLQHAAELAPGEWPFDLATPAAIVSQIG